MGTIGRLPLQIVEIDMPRCTRTYGSLPCTAVLGTTGQRKCFNTLKTCQSAATYADAPFTMRFADNTSDLPDDLTIFPALKSVSARSGRVNLSGIDPTRSALGQRARVTVTLQDFTWQDTETDPYQAERVSGAAQASGVGYNPKDRGTFFARFQSRWPYYLGKSLRVLDGYAGDALAAMRTRNFIITGWAGPNAAGVVTITAADVLDLADAKKSQAPRPSQGKVLADITYADTTLTLTPAGVGAEYNSAGYVTIGREVAAFTRAADVLTLTARGLFGTLAAAHKANDLVQEALVYTDMTVDTIISDLLVTYAGVNSTFIDSVAWADEVLRWLGGFKFSGVVAKPEGVNKLIGELCQHGFIVWWDEIAQQIRLKCNRPLDIGESYFVISDADNILEGSASIEDMPDERASQINLWHGVIDPTQSLSSDANFRKLVVSPDLTNPYGEDRIKEIFTRWFGEDGDDALASVVADRLISRYKVMPRNMTVDLDVKDLATMDLTALVQMETRLIAGDDGSVLPYQMQVLSREEVDPGNRFRIEAQTFNLLGRFGFYMQAGDPDYDIATAQERLEGSYYTDGTIGTLSGDDPYEYF